MNTIYLEPNKVPQHLRGDYSGKKFKAVVTTELTIPSHAGMWDGGSRDSYRFVHLESGRAAQASDNMSSPWNDARQDQTVQLVPGIAAIRHTMLQGTDMGLTFYVHPDNAAQLLPAPAAELTDTEEHVLEATCSLKSSYGGKDRYQMYTDYDRSMGRTVPSRVDWDNAKASLIAKGLLNKAGVVTPAGRNVRK